MLILAKVAQGYTQPAAPPLPFLVTVENLYPWPGMGFQGPSGLWTRNGNTLCPSYFFPTIRITNNQPTRTLIDDLTIEMMTNGQQWAMMPQLPTQTLRVYLGDEKSGSEISGQFLDREIADRDFVPGETVRGTLLLDYPQTLNPDTILPIF